MRQVGEVATDETCTAQSLVGLRVGGRHCRHSHPVLAAAACLISVQADQEHAVWGDSTARWSSQGAQAVTQVRWQAAV